MSNVNCKLSCSYSRLVNFGDLYEQKKWKMTVLTTRLACHIISVHVLVTWYVVQHKLVEKYKERRLIVNICQRGFIKQQLEENNCSENRKG